MPEYPTPITGLPPGRVDVLIVEDERELAEATAEYLDAIGDQQPSRTDGGGRS